MHSGGGFCGSNDRCWPCRNPPPASRTGKFFTEWGVRLSDSCVGQYCGAEPIAFYVDGKPYKEDPRAIELSAGKEIAIVIGAPPARIPKTGDFSSA